MIAKVFLVRWCGLLLLLASFNMCGCAASNPAFAKIFQPPRKAPTHFSCGEGCPKSAKHVEYATHHEHDGHQH